VIHPGIQNRSIGVSMEVSWIWPDRTTDLPMARGARRSDSGVKGALCSTPDAQAEGGVLLQEFSRFSSASMSS